MAEQAVASAVVGQITDRTFSTVMRKLRAPATTHERLQRLEMLLLRIRSAIEVSEKHAIESSSLLQWRQKFTEAVEEGDQVLRGFQQRARDDEAARNAAAAVQQGGDEGGSSSIGGNATGASLAVSFTWTALSGMARRMHSATKALFSSDEDMERMNRSLERLEKLSPDIQEFIILLHLEISPKLRQRPAKRRKRPEIHEPLMFCSLRSTLTSPNDEQRSTGRTKEEADMREEICGVTVQMMDAEALGKEKKELAGMLREVMICMGRAAKRADEKNLEDFECLAQWTAVLQEAVQRGNVLVGDILAGGETADDLYGFARTVDRLAWDMPSFDFLVGLCPWNDKLDALV